MKRIIRSFRAILTSVASAVLLLVVFVTPASAAQPLTFVPTADFGTYCKAHGYDDAALVAQNAYGWRCVRGPGGQREEVTFSVGAVCREVTIKDNSPTVLDFLNDFTHAGDLGWWCYRLSQVAPLGRLDVNRYCVDEGNDRAALVGGNTALSWQCQAPNNWTVPLDSVGKLSVACGRQYPSNLGDVAARVVDFHNPNAIDCMV
jgi:hypothetical protein